jgi:transposase
MGAASRLRDDYGADDLRGFACKARDGAQARRLMALAAVADGKRRAEAAAIGLMDRQTLRDWVVRFNAEGAEGLIDKTSPGRPPKLTPAQKQELRQVVGTDRKSMFPTSFAGGAPTWRLWRRRASRSTATRQRSDGCCGNSASPTSVRGPGIPRRTSRLGKRLKKLRRARDGTRQGSAAGHTRGDLVPG